MGPCKSVITHETFKMHKPFIEVGQLQRLPGESRRKDTDKHTEILFFVAFLGLIRPKT